MNSIVKLAARVLVGSLPLLAVAGAPARASVPRSSTQVVVRYGDLDLGTQSGAELLYSRIGHAARTVCGGADYQIHLEARRSVRQCQQQAIHKAVEQVDRAELTATYTARFGGAAPGHASHASLHTPNSSAHPVG